MDGCRTFECMNRQPDEQARRSWGGLDGHRASEQRGTLTNPSQSEVHRAVEPNPLWIESSSVILDDRNHGVGGALQHDTDILRVRMPGDVCQRFLDDTIHGRFHRGRQALPAVAAAKVGCDAGLIGPFLDVRAERRDEAEIVQRRWTKVTCQSMDAPLDFFDLVLQTHRPIRIARFQLVEPDPEDAQLLPHLVMELSSDTAPFVLLCADQLEQPLAPCLLQRGPLGQGLRKACVAVVQIRCPLHHPELEFVPRVSKIINELFVS